MVVEQSDSVFNSNEERAAFFVDVPVKGPQALVESVMALINKEMYNACEDCVHFDEDIKSFNPEDLCTKDGEHLVSHYMESYKTLLQDSLWKSFFNLKMKMEAQTETYVTYSMEQYHCGGSCGSELYYYTFDKKDGHQIEEVISQENLVKFFEDHPEYATLGDLVENFEWTFDPEDEYENTRFGLLSDRFVLVIEGIGNHYFTVRVPYVLISSYLTPEVQALVGQNK